MFDQAALDCVKASLSEMFGIAAITAIIAYIRGRGVEVLAEKGFKLLLKQLLHGFVKKGATRLIPWLGVALFILDLILILKDCL